MGCLRCGVLCRHIPPVASVAGRRSASAGLRAFYQPLGLRIEPLERLGLAQASRAAQSELGVKVGTVIPHPREVPDVARDRPDGMRGCSLVGSSRYC